MRRTSLCIAVSLFVAAVLAVFAYRIPTILADVGVDDWPQWGQNPQHSGSIAVQGQFPNNKLASMTYDPFVPKEQAENNGELLAHYQAPLTNGQDVFMEFISGKYVSCNPPGSYARFLVATTTGSIKSGARSACTGKGAS